LEAATSKPVRTNSVGGLKLSWRDHKYHRFYAVVDQLVDELQKHVWVKTGKAKRRLKGDGLEKLHYSVECLVRDCMAVVLQRKRKSEAAIRKGQYHYSSERPDQMLTYSIHIERAFEGLVELGYLEVTKLGYFDRNGRKDGTPTSRLSRYIASDRLLDLFTALIKNHNLIGMLITRQAGHQLHSQSLNQRMCIVIVWQVLWLVTHIHMIVLHGSM
jgi:hypothetical protein